jgi:hypothetical protein
MHSTAVFHTAGVAANACTIINANHVSKACMQPPCARLVHIIKSSQVNTLPKAKSKTRSKQNKDMHKCSSVYIERGVPLPVLTSGGE